MSGATYTTMMVSCREREGDRIETLSDLRRTDWGQSPIVVLDDEGERTRMGRITRTWGRAFARAAHYPSGAFLFIEDDLRFNRHLALNLARWSWAPMLAAGAESVFVGSLYNTSSALASLAAGADYLVGLPQAFWGAQALVLSRAAVVRLAAEWQKRPEAQPEARIAAILGAPVVYHLPSLVRHVGVSTWNPLRRLMPHDAADFDREWVARAA